MKNTFGNAVSMTILMKPWTCRPGAVLDGLAQQACRWDEAAIAAAMDPPPRP